VLELAQESIHLSTNGTSLDTPATDYWTKLDADTFLRNINETALLVRALSWVQRASQDERVHAYIAESVPSIYTNMSSIQASDRENTHAVTLWCIISSLRHNDMADPYSALRVVGPKNAPHASPTIASLRRILGVVTYDNRHLRDLRKPRFTWPLDSSDVTILYRMLLLVIKVSTSRSYWMDIDTSVRGTLEWISLWHGCTDSFNTAEWQLEALRVILCSSDWDRLYQLAPDLCPMALRIVLRQAKVAMGRESKKLSKISRSSALF
jgi:hypothetical protein